MGGVPVKIAVGAIAPGEVVELEISPPPGLDLTAVTRAISVTMEQEGQAPATLSPWTTVSVTASLWVVRFLPSGVEFVAVGPMRLLPDVTLDGTLYRYRAVSGDVFRR
jgi:hypothetical protein